MHLPPTSAAPSSSSCLSYTTDPIKMMLADYHPHMPPQYYPSEFELHGLDCQSLPTPSVEKCAYRTGKCFNARAYKRNGKPHKLCAFHREKANLNQMKLDQKKRQRRGSSGCEDDDGDSSSTTERPRKHRCVERPSLSALVQSPLPTRIDDAPPILAVDELDFFCDAMSPRQSKLFQDHQEAVSRATTFTLEVVV
ncbi:hypothetical protein DYB30_003854 [Aphanomyces astaci]|uniref:Uncharacterized protein n=1 Tax=Aphanomyces astaci TaxID=112090 RepID=A0A397FB90_APHAT|nr:hypothetical protein DYB30_003854 [Aphanomyces astaci]RHY58471.1 hypothetical protein DYB34_005588 [Aphanomyces astaci]RHZ17970.1 hypothetical protein DYB31_006862 [Aphanomyces astaci]